MAHLRRSPRSFSYREYPIRLPTLATFPTRGRLCVGDSSILVSQPSPLGKGDRAAVDRVLSFIVDLRRSSSLFFIPLETYPARFARHLPHAGKAVCRGYRFPHPTSAPSGHLLPEEGGSVHASPFPWKRLPSAARRGWLPQQVEKEWKEAFPRFVIPSAAEGSFSFPVSVFFRNAVCMKHRPSDSLGARCFPLTAILTSFA